ncbi:multidrug DMT transporter permease [Hydrogenophaga electricum]|uniref:Multidrug DMT transporter permease n=2 Tax=Hydrogenophaga electricum TaxID=1230953 RepID=A0ABQ6C7L7_9BURK|nr:multidrug DMT transporter permease [Hydrogenophaga electricum]
MTPAQGVSAGSLGQPGALPPGMATGILAGLAAGAFWGTTFVAPLAAPGFSSVDYTAGRFVACGLFSALLMLWQWGRSRRGGAALRRPTGRQVLAAAGLSVLGYTGYYLLLVLAIADAGAALPVLIIGTIPLWVMMLGKPAGLRWSSLVPGLLLTAAGMALMMRATAADVDVDGARHLVRGVLFGVGAMASWTVFGLFNARWLRRNEAVNSTEWANWLGLAAGVGGWLLWLGAGTPWAELAERPGLGRFVFVCTFTGIGSAWVASVLWNVACRRLSSSLAGQLIVSETVFGLCYAFIWSGQWPQPVQWGASGLFVLGILASIRAHR